MSLIISLVGSISIAVSFWYNGGCRRTPDPEAVAKYQQQVEQKEKAKQVQVTQIRNRLKVLRDEMTRRENIWRDSVLARHADWTPEQKKSNLAVLTWKWHNGNRSTVEKTVDDMIRFGSLVYTHQLTRDDYRDIAAQRFAIQDTLYGEYKKLREDLEKLDKLQNDDYWAYVY